MPAWMHLSSTYQARISAAKREAPHVLALPSLLLNEDIGTCMMYLAV